MAERHNDRRYYASLPTPLPKGGSSGGTSPGKGSSKGSADPSSSSGSGAKTGPVKEGFVLDDDVVEPRAGSKNAKDAEDAQDADAAGRLPKPQIKIIVNGESVYKPGMKVYFAENEKDSGNSGGSSSSVTTSSAGHALGTIRSVASTSTVMGTYCSCDMVIVSRPDYKGVGGTMCLCNSECTCDSHCTCQSVNTCPAFRSPGSPGSPRSPGGGCPAVSCNGPCACVPVH
ncbi:MAG: hypothetical protein FWE94_06150 [Coriobacteriia bacterium]|nr:hypothetical protein [Coriobacteriia bacterium]